MSKRILGGICVVILGTISKAIHARYTKNTFLRVSEGYLGEMQKINTGHIYKQNSGSFS